MATFKNVSGIRLDIPLYDLHVDADETFEVPDDQAAFFDGQVAFESAKATKANPPTYTPDVAVTGPVPVQSPAPVPAGVTTTAS